MAGCRTKFLVLVLVLVTKTNCDNDVVANQNVMDDIRADLLREKAQNPVDEPTDFRGSTIEEDRYNIEPERSMNDFDNETDTDNIEVRTTTVREYTTTESTSNGDDNLEVEEEEEEVNKNNDTDDKNEEDAVVAATEQIETDGLENDVIKTRQTIPDIYVSDNRSTSEMPRTDPTTQSTTRAMDEMDDFVPRIAELGDDLEITGQRNPKTENSDPKLPIDRRAFDAIPHPPPVVSKSSTLKSWLEDSWSRPPAGILVPLRPMALTRALAVWNDLTAAGGLDVADIVIVGYDSNGINWRSRHNLQPSSTGSGDRAVSEALSRLLLKYQGVNSDSGSDGTMRALASAAKLVPYDSSLFVITDKGAGDPQRLPLALRALVDKRLKVYIIWTDSNNPNEEQELELQELRNVSRHTQGDVLPYSLQVMDMESNLASETDLQEWDTMDIMMQKRRGRVNSQVEVEKFETLLVRRGGGEALSLGVPVENGVTALRVYIEGAVEHAVLYPPNDAPQIDLYNITSVASFSKSSKTQGLAPRDVLLVFPGVNMETDMLSVIPASPPKSDSAMVGTWHLSVRCDTCDYRLCVGARAQLHFDVDEDEKPDLLKFRITGPVASVRESVLIDEYGSELAKLPYNYPPMTRDPEDNADNPTNELVADVKLPDVKGSRVYAKIVGRDVRGEPFVRLAGPLIHQSEVRMGRSAAIASSEARNDLEAAEESNSRIYNARLQNNDSNALPYNRAVSQVVNQRGTLLTSVQIGLSSRLYAAPGNTLQIHFEVTNFREQTVFFRFGAVGELNFLRGITPLQQNVLSGQTVNVIVNVGITSTAQAGARDLITFTAYGQEQVSISAYVYVTNPSGPSPDTWAPEVRHEFQGSCIGRMGDDCAQYVWSASIFARDAVSGLLRLTSAPIGLAYDSNFISGSRDEVMATYRATCCAPRLLVTAVDALGNTNSYVVDISNYITSAGIAAIVLGVILGLALIIFIIVMIVWCVRRRRESKELPSAYTSSRNMS